jgi:hypothetical protein
MVHACRYITFHAFLQQLKSTIGYSSCLRTGSMVEIEVIRQPSVFQNCCVFKNVRCLYVRVCVSIPALTFAPMRLHVNWTRSQGDQWKPFSQHGAQNKHRQHRAIHYINLTGGCMWCKYIMGILTVHIFTELEFWLVTSHLSMIWQYAWVYKWLEIYVSIYAIEIHLEYKLHVAAF